MAYFGVLVWYFGLCQTVYYHKQWAIQSQHGYVFAYLAARYSEIDIELNYERRILGTFFALDYF